MVLHEPANPRRLQGRPSHAHALILQETTASPLPPTRLKQFSRYTASHTRDPLYPVFPSGFRRRFTVWLALVRMAEDMSLKNWGRFGSLHESPRVPAWTGKGLRTKSKKEVQREARRWDARHRVPCYHVPSSRSDNLRSTSSVLGTQGMLWGLPNPVEAPPPPLNSHQAERKRGAQSRELRAERRSQQHTRAEGTPQPNHPLPYNANVSSGSLQLLVGASDWASMSASGVGPWGWTNGNCAR